MNRKILISGLLLTLITGCQSYNEDKQAVMAKWKAASSQVKLNLAKQSLENGQYEKAMGLADDQMSASCESSQACMIFGQACFAKGETDKGWKTFEKAVQKDPNLAQGWYLLGMTFRQKGDLKRASESLEKAVALDPTNSQYNLALARCYSYTGQNDGAKDILLRQIESNPDDASLMVEIADIMSHSGQIEKAIVYYKRALVLNPDDSAVSESLGYCYLELGKWDLAANIFCTLLDNDKSENGSKYLRILATCYMNAKEYGWACTYYDKLSAIDRSNPHVWLQMGQAALGAGYAQRAYECAQKALEFRPMWTDAVVLKGCSLYMDNKYNEAINCFVESAADKNMKGFSWLMIGRCYELMGQQAVAKKAYQNAIGFNADNKLLTLLTGR